MNLRGRRGPGSLRRVLAGLVAGLAVVLGVLIAVAIIGTLSTASDYRDGGERARARQQIANQLLTDLLSAQSANRAYILLPSGDNAFLYLGLKGAPATITAESNFATRAIGEFHAACRARDLDRALDLFARRRRYRDLFRDGLAGGRPMFVPYTKAAMEILGTPVGPPRPPQRPVPPVAIAPLREALRREFGLEGRPPA